MNKIKKTKNKKVKSKIDKEKLLLVFSKDFVTRYKKCKISSCMSGKEETTTFYVNNGFILATLEDNKGDIYGRTVIFGDYYSRIYCKQSLQGTFRKMLKEYGLKKMTSNPIFFKLKDFSEVPYIDDFYYINKDFTKMSNKYDENFSYTFSFGDRFMMIYYICNICGYESRVTQCSIGDDGDFVCGKCEGYEEKIQKIKNDSKINLSGFFKEDKIKRKEIKMCEDIPAFKPIINGEYKKLVVDFNGIKKYK